MCDEQSFAGMFMLDNLYLNHRLRDAINCKALLYVFVGLHFGEVHHLPDSGVAKEDVFSPGDSAETHIEAKLDEKDDVVYDIKIIGIKEPKVLKALWRKWVEEDAILSEERKDKRRRYYRVIITNFDSRGKKTLSETVTNNYGEKKPGKKKVKKIKGVMKFIFVNTMHDDWQIMPDEWFDPKKGRPKPRSSWTADDRELERKAITVATNINHSKGVMYILKETGKDEKDGMEKLKEEMDLILDYGPQWLDENWREIEKLGIDVDVKAILESDFNLSFGVKTADGKKMDVKFHADAEGTADRKWNILQTNKL